MIKKLLKSHLKISYGNFHGKPGYVVKESRAIVHLQKPCHDKGEVPQ